MTTFKVTAVGNAKRTYDYEHRQDPSDFIDIRIEFDRTLSWEEQTNYVNKIFPPFSGSNGKDAGN